MKAYNKEVMTNPKVIKDNKKAMIKIANLGLDKENIKRRNAFLDEARKVYNESNKEENWKVLLQNKIQDNCIN